MAHQHGPTTSAQLVSPAPGDEVVPAAEPRTMALPVEGLMFRFVRDGDQAPFDFHTQAPELLCWFCPALSMAEATALARMGNGMTVTAENLQRLVLDNIEAVRAAGATLPASEARSYTLRDIEPRTERVHRVAAQIVADATDLRIDALGDAPRLVERRWVDGVEHRVFVEPCRTAADVTITVGWAEPSKP